MKAQTVSHRALWVLGFLLVVSAGNAQVDNSDQKQSRENAQSFCPGYSADEDGSDQRPLKPGTKIRIRTQAGYRTGHEKEGYLEGRFHSLEGGVLTMVIDDESVSLPYDRIFHLQVKTGGGGAWPGALLGLAIGGLAAAAAQPDRSDEGLAALGHIEEDMTRGGMMVLAGVVLGAAVGGALGAPKWQNVTLHQEAHSLMGETETTHHLGYSFRF